jgi:hypothetical protein
VEVVERDVPPRAIGIVGAAHAIGVGGNRSVAALSGRRLSLVEQESGEAGYGPTDPLRAPRMTHVGFPQV